MQHLFFWQTVLLNLKCSTFLIINSHSSRCFFLSWLVCKTDSQSKNQLLVHITLKKAEKSHMNRTHRGAIHFCFKNMCKFNFFHHWTIDFLFLRLVWYRLSIVAPVGECAVSWRGHSDHPPWSPRHKPKELVNISEHRPVYFISPVAAWTPALSRGLLGTPAKKRPTLTI